MSHSIGRAYFDKKLAEGKTRNEAMRCLKRRLFNHIWRMTIADERHLPPLGTVTKLRLDERRGSPGPTEARWFAFSRFSSPSSSVVALLPQVRMDPSTHDPTVKRGEPLVRSRSKKIIYADTDRFEVFDRLNGAVTAVKHIAALMRLNCRVPPFSHFVLDSEQT